MPVKSLSLSIPDAAPYDRQETWFSSFVGNNLLPIIESVNFSRFWFTQYGAVSAGKSILFRFEIDDLNAIAAYVAELQQKFPSGPDGYTDYGHAGDLGCGENSRFFGNNSRHQDKDRRGELAFDFVHACAKLYIDCLSGPDQSGYYQLEEEKSSGFNIETSFEQYHHLVCNMTYVPTFVVEATHPEVNGTKIFSLIQFAGLNKRDQRWTMQRMVKVVF